MVKPGRVLLAKMTFDAHDRGIRYIAAKLRDAGLETIFIRFSLVDEVVRAALQEGVDVIAVGIYTGGHMIIIPELIEAMRREDIADIPLVVGGIVPQADAEELKKQGVAEVFGPGRSAEEVVKYIQEITGEAAAS